MSPVPRLRWLAVRLCLKTVFAGLRFFAPHMDHQRDYEQATRAFSPQLSLALDILDQDRRR